MKLKVMTFNLRLRTESDGINMFDNREKRVLKAIADESPDLIGFQEATDYQRDFLRKNLSDTYVVLGCGRGKDYHGESVCIAYKRDVFDLISYETFWLAVEPYVAGSRYRGSDQSFCPRLTVRAELMADGLDAPIHFFNTHLDHQGPVSRTLGMTQIMQKVSECKGKFVLTGDMNAKPDTDVIAVAKSLRTKEVHEATECVTHTFHNYGRIAGGCKIDYIFTDGRTLDAYAVEDIPENGVYISDHYPVCANIEL